MKVVVATALALATVACVNSPDSKSPAKQGQACDGIRKGFSCPVGLVCERSVSSGESPSADPPLGGRTSWRCVTEEWCGLGETAHRCAPGYVCQKLIPAPSATGASPPGGPSSLDGACGGIAGYHCAEGLFCQMPDDQKYVADGMGTCVSNSQCVVPTTGIAPDVR